MKDQVKSAASQVKQDVANKAKQAEAAATEVKAKA